MMSDVQKTHKLYHISIQRLSIKLRAHLLTWRLIGVVGTDTENSACGGQQHLEVAVTQRKHAFTRTFIGLGRGNIVDLWSKDQRVVTLRSVFTRRYQFCPSFAKSCQRWGAIQGGSKRVIRIVFEFPMNKNYTSMCSQSWQNWDEKKLKALIDQFFLDKKRLVKPFSKKNLAEFDVISWLSESAGSGCGTKVASVVIR